MSTVGSDFIESCIRATGWMPVQHDGKKLRDLHLSVVQISDMDDLAEFLVSQKYIIPETRKWRDNGPGAPLIQTWSVAMGRPAGMLVGESRFVNRGEVVGSFKTLRFATWKWVERFVGKMQYDLGMQLLIWMVVAKLTENRDVDSVQG